MRKIFLIMSFSMLTFIFASACSTRETVDGNINKPPQNASAANSRPDNSSAAAIKTPAQSAESKPESFTEKSCKTLKKDGFALDQKQTFAVDFAPFQKSCFAVFHNPEFTNPNLGAQYFIYRNGKEIFSFPEQFNGGNVPCSVEAVDFEDFNDDNLTDIVIVGKCGADSADYNENMLYINTGKGFETDKSANMEMIDFATIPEIKQYLQDRQKTFGR